MFGFPSRVLVLFVCTENICRSPMAEALARSGLHRAGLSRKVRVASAGTGVSQAGRKPDVRAQRLLAEAGVGCRGIRSKQVKAEDIAHSDYVLAMDTTHLESLLALCPRGHEDKIGLLLGHSSGSGTDVVPDPYYGSVEDYQQVFELLQEGVADIVAFLDANRERRSRR